MRIGFMVRCDGCGRKASYPNGLTGGPGPSVELPVGWECYSGIEDGIMPAERVHVCSAACAAKLGDPPDVKVVNANRVRFGGDYTPARVTLRREPWLTA